VAPVLELLSDSCGHAISGDRSGNVKFWDLQAGECTWSLKSVHKGHVTALAWADPAGGNDALAGCFASGGQDGILRLWDPREHSNPAKLALHISKEGKGAVTGIVLGALCFSAGPESPTTAALVHALGRHLVSRQGDFVLHWAIKPSNSDSAFHTEARCTTPWCASDLPDKPTIR
jgi:hypothetical protein